MNFVYFEQINPKHIILVMRAIWPIKGRSPPFSVTSRDTPNLWSGSRGGRRSQWQSLRSPFKQRIIWFHFPHIRDLCWQYSTWWMRHLIDTPVWATTTLEMDQGLCIWEVSVTINMLYVEIFRVNAVSGKFACISISLKISQLNFV